MNNKRENSSSTSIQNKLFVFGGSTHEYLNSSEMMDLSDLSDDKNKSKLKSKWINLTTMKYKKESIGIKYFKNKNQIILIGVSGYDDCERSFSIFEMKQ